MKRIIYAIFLSILLLLPAACAKPSSIDGKVKIVTTIFPAYDFARQVGGENADVTMLLPPGSESHNYEPTAKDIIKIQECDLFIYNGGESDAWVEKVLSSLEKKPENMKMIHTVSTVNEEITDGMEHNNTTTGNEIDEHIWTSPKNAIKIVQGICAKICIIDGKNSSVYENNALQYVEKIQNIDREFDTYFLKQENRTMIFGDRFPLRYFKEEYGLTCYAAFPGCASETEASSKTVSFLIDKAKETGAKKIFYIEFSSHSLADTIASEAGATSVLFHSCHNVTADEFNNGSTYVSLMTENLERLRG
ncbi:MAG: zinc ABC transporter substrate-binding protein [Clostridiales bacterium]|nr:MAG: zinc ABC transporter substrate-binding protein [Clostridiales bacterium]